MKRLKKKRAPKPKKKRRPRQAPVRRVKQKPKPKDPVADPPVPVLAVDNGNAEMARRYREAAAGSMRAAESTERGELVFTMGAAEARTAEQWRQRAMAQEAEADRLERA